MKVGRCWTLTPHLAQSRPRCLRGHSWESSSSCRCSPDAEHRGTRMAEAWRHPALLRRRRLRQSRGPGHPSHHPSASHQPSRPRAPRRPSGATITPTDSGPRNLPDARGRGHRGQARGGWRLPRSHPARPGIRRLPERGHQDRAARRARHRDHAGQSLRVPFVGEHVAEFGTWVLELDHGWREIHSIWSITYLDAGTRIFSLPPVPLRYHPGGGGSSGGDGGGNCDPTYPTVCIPPPPPDLDCSQIPYRNFKVLPPDPTGLTVTTTESDVRPRAAIGT